MAQKLIQSQQITQTQNLLPQQIKLMKMLELSVPDMEQLVRDELTENMALEEKGKDEDKEKEQLETEQEETAFEEDYQPLSQNEEELGNYATVDDVPDYILNRVIEEQSKSEYNLTQSQSFYDVLTAQMYEYDLSEEDQQRLSYLIGSLDDDGFLRKSLSTLASELYIYQNLDTTESDLERLLNVLQHFEPKGIGARNLQECLLLQVDNEDYHSPYKTIEIQLLQKYFEAFTRKHWDYIATRLKLSPSDLLQVKSELIHLNPRPGMALNESSSSGAMPIIPDFILEITSNNELVVKLNSGEIPSLRISKNFQEAFSSLTQNRSLLNKREKENLVYVRQRLNAASDFISLLQQRQQTLLLVAQAIVEAQKTFWEEGDEMELSPLLQKDIAEQLQIDISVVSRIVSTKYIETPYGVFSLKYFFTRSFTAQDGSEQVTKRVKQVLKAVIEEENKKHPLSDEALVKAMKDRGYTLARRTIAKYREEMNIPIARLRK